MKTLALICLGLLGVWWALLAVWAISCHRDRARSAAKPMTPEELEECRKLEASIPRYHLRFRDYLITGPFMIPFIFICLPLYLYEWFVPDPYKKHDNAA